MYDLRSSFRLHRQACVRGLKNLDDSAGLFMPLHQTRPTLNGEFPYDASTYVVQNANAVYWEDRLRLSRYAPARVVPRAPTT
jgi:hypothetical protein